MQWGVNNLWKSFFIVVVLSVANAKVPIYAPLDGIVKAEIEWENANAENTEVMDFQKFYNDCMESEGSAIKNEFFCVDSIALSLEPASDKCAIYYYSAIYVVRGNEVYDASAILKSIQEYEVKKGDLIGYSYSEKQSKPETQKTNNRGCK